MTALLEFRRSANLKELSVLVAGASLLVHLLFKRLEPIFPRTWALFLVPIPLILILTTKVEAFDTVSSIFTILGLFYGTLITSIVAYRLSPFHPLAKYPGPLIARVTKFWGVYITRTGRQHVYLKEVHERYGDFVRVGPNEVSVRNVDAIVPMMGPKGMPKGPFYDARIPPNSPANLLGLRGAEHIQRRKPWSRAFSSAALKNYEELVVKRGIQLAGILEQKQGQALDLSKWIQYFVFDFMSDFVFGGGLEMMKEGGDKSNLWGQLEAAMRGFAIVSHIPWSVHVTRWLVKDAFVLGKWARKQVADRRERGATTTKDLFYWLAGEDGTKGLSIPETLAEGGLVIVAGSDTTTFTLCNLFFYLMSNPNDMLRLRNEINEVFPDGELPFNVAKLSHMDFLNACLDETMRLQPAVSSGSQRMVPQGHGDFNVLGHTLPEGTNTFIPTFAIQSDPRYFYPAHDSFWPDRWLPRDKRQSQPPITGPEVLDLAAFIPFSYGPAACVGKNLALQEMRMMAALLVQKFNFEFAKGYDPSQWEDQLEDFYVRGHGKLPTVITKA